MIKKIKRNDEDDHKRIEQCTYLKDRAVSRIKSAGGVH